MNESKKYFVEMIIAKYLQVAPNVFTHSGTHASIMMIISNSKNPTLYQIPSGEKRFDFYEEMKAKYQDAIAVITITEVWDRKMDMTHPYFEVFVKTGLIPDEIRNKLPKKEFLYFQIERLYEPLIEVHRWEILRKNEKDNNPTLGPEMQEFVRPNQHSAGLIIKRNKN